MKKIRIIISIVLIGLCFFIISCHKEDPIKGSLLKPLGDDQGVETELDKWAIKNFTEPYNVKLIYKFDDTKISQDDYATPVKYEKAVQMANILKYLFFEPFEKHTSKEFLKKFAPKEIVLMGSSVVNPNGTEKLGVAESGVKFVLFKINKLDVNDSEKLFKYYFRTIYHEFSHVLHQTKIYSPQFGKISATDYVRDSWNTEWKERSSLEKGFFSDYSTKNDNEDFVELIAHYLTFSEDKWEEQVIKAAGVDGTDPNEGRLKLQNKIAIVKDYMSKEWGIDMDALRNEILDRASKLDTLDTTVLN